MLAQIENPDSAPVLSGTISMKISMMAKIGLSK